MINNMQQTLQEVYLIFFNIGKWGSAFASLVFCGAAVAAEPAATLTIQVSGLAHERGHTVANLFHEGDDVLKPDKAYRHAQAEIHDGKATLNFPDLAYGTYAVSVFHDENDNGKLDHNFLMFPAEPLGFSNGFEISFLAGLPSFEKLRFSFDADTKPLDIAVRTVY